MHIKNSIDEVCNGFCICNSYGIKQLFEIFLHVTYLELKKMLF